MIQEKLKNSSKVSKVEVIIFVGAMAFPFVVGFLFGWGILYICLLDRGNIGFLDFLSVGVTKDPQTFFCLSTGFTIVLGGLFWAFMYGKMLDMIVTEGRL